MEQAFLGIDIGGSGIKGAIVDVAQGRFISDRLRISTPQPATPESVGQVIETLVQHFGWRGPIGCTFPAIIKQGVAYSAANIDSSWLGVNVSSLLSVRLGLPVLVLNDADAAGVAEMAYGAARDRRGTVLLLTFGTGVGSALLVDGLLVPNTELGHMYVHGHEVEALASDRARKRDRLSWRRWARRLDRIFVEFEQLFSPDLFVVGGGVSKDFQRFAPLLNLRTPIVPAALRNRAGIIGAALAVSQMPAELGTLERAQP